jgi:hypothetical protein
VYSHRYVSPVTPTGDYLGVSADPDSWVVPFRRPECARYVAVPVPPV